MGCEWWKGPDGTVVHLNIGRGGGRRKPCPFCKKGRVTKECDYPIGHGKTCDASMCDSCATNLGGQHTKMGNGFTKLNDTKDVCPIHKGQPWPQEQNV
jgi:hypothetical protein